MYEFLVDDVSNKDFAQEEAWFILIVDDEPAVHTITKFSLQDESFEGKKFVFISAYSAQEAKQILKEQPNIALVLLDVVMETDTAGLDVAAWIRDELKNNLIRIVLRTGEPGQAPEQKVIIEYDIFDYKNKTELTAQKLFSCVVSGLRSYRDVQAITNHSVGLKKVVESTADLFNQQYTKQYATGILLQLTAVLYYSADAMLVNYFNDSDKEQGIESTAITLLASTGAYQDNTEQSVTSIIPADELSAALSSNDVIYQKKIDNKIIVSYKARDQHRTLLYLQYKKLVTDEDMSLIELFVQSVAIAQEKLRFWQETEDSLNEIIEALSRMFERHAKQGDKYFTGVTQIALLLARKHGLMLKKQGINLGREKRLGYRK